MVIFFQSSSAVYKCFVLIFINFSETGWNKIDHLWRRGRREKKRIRGMRWSKFGADEINLIFETVKECVGKGGCIMGTLEVSLRDFDEELF